MKMQDNIIVIEIDLLWSAYHGRNSQKLNVGNHFVRAGCKGLWESDTTLGLFLQNPCSVPVDANKQ